MIESAMFKGREPLGAEDLQRLTLPGFGGAFRTMVFDSGLNPEREVFFATIAMLDSHGAILGCQPVKCGVIPTVSINLKDVWDDSELEGKLVVEEHDASTYQDVNGLLSTSWTDQVPWKVKVNQEGK